MELSIKKLTSLTAGSAFRFQSLLVPIWKLLTFSPANEHIMPRKNLTLSLEKGMLSAAYGTKLFSKISLRATREYPCQEDRYPQPDEVVSSASLARNEFGAAGAEITLGIPKSWTIIRTAEFPATVKENLPAVIAYEMDRLTPFAAEEAYYDYRVLQETADRITIVLMAAKAEAVDPYLSALRENGFTVDRLTLNLSGTATLLKHSEPGSEFLVVKIDETHFEGALSSSGTLTTSFSQLFSGSDESAKADKVAAEINTVLTQAKAKAQVVLWIRDKSPSFRALLKLRLTIPFRILGEGDGKLKISSNRELPYAAAGTMIESLWSKSTSLNLLRKGIIQKQKTPILLTLVLLAALGVLGVIYTVQPLKIERLRLEEVETQLSPKKNEVKKIETLKKEVEALETELATIRMFKESRPSSLSITKELTVVVPKTTWLTRMRITETTVEIEGQSSSATELLPKLEASKLFRKAEFSSPTFRDAKTAKERFNVRMEIEGSKKLEDMVKKETKKPEEESKKAQEKPTGRAGNGQQ